MTDKESTPTEHPEKHHSDATHIGDALIKGGAIFGILVFLGMIISFMIF